MSFQYKALTIALLGFALTACGGSHRSEYENKNPPASKALSGVVVDPYISGATVFCGESTSTVKTTTNSAGQFTFDAGCDKALTVTGGTDTGTGLPFTGTLQYPASTLANVVITPISTIAVLTGTDLNALGTKLGLDLTKDPMTDKALLQATVSTQQLLTQLQNTLGATGATSVDVQKGIVAALKTVLASTTPLDLTKPASLPIQKALQDAATAAGKTIPPEDAAKLALAIQDNVQKVSDAVGTLTGPITPDTFKANVADVVKDAEQSKPQVVTNALSLTNVAFGNASFSADKVLAANAANPLAVTAPLDQINVSVTQPTTVTTVNGTKLAVSYEINSTKSINFIFDNVSTTYVDGKITSFKLPKDATYNYEVIGGATAVKGKSTNVNEDSFTVANGAVGFSLDNLLKRVSTTNNAFKVDGYKPVAKDAVTFTVALSGDVAVNGVNAAQYTIAANSTSFAGKGIQAVTKVQ
jgi:hypothetical protein